MPLLGVSTYRELKRWQRAPKSKQHRRGGRKSYRFCTICLKLWALAVSRLAHLLLCWRDIFCIEAFLANSGLPEA